MNSSPPSDGAPAALYAAFSTPLADEIETAVSSFDARQTSAGSCVGMIAAKKRAEIALANLRETGRTDYYLAQALLGVLSEVDPDLAETVDPLWRGDARNAPLVEFSERPEPVEAVEAE